MWHFLFCGDPAMEQQSLAWIKSTLLYSSSARQLHAVFEEQAFRTKPA